MAGLVNHTITRLSHVVLLSMVPHSCQLDECLYIHEKVRTCTRGTNFQLGLRAHYTLS